MADSNFPIKTKTACQLKWAWSTLYLNTGVTRSCHRTGESTLTTDNFLDFHNTTLKLEDRASMLEGKWPENSCSYCKDIETAGGTSDRMRMMTIPNLSPWQLSSDPTLTRVDPTIVEVYFNNTCNLGCLYCGEHLSSTIEAENRKWGHFNQDGINLRSNIKQFKSLVPMFWKWFEDGFSKIKRLHVLGGEPFYQTEFDKLLDMIELYPNPECELNIVTNLMISKDRLEKYVGRFRDILRKRLLKRIDITCSIDCWGEEQEYVRYGIKLDRWEDNFQYLLGQKWLTLNINQTISCLTIKTMPDLLIKLTGWRQQHPIGHYFSEVFPNPSYLKPDIFGGVFFIEDFQKILSLMPDESEQDRITLDYMKGIFTRIEKSDPNPTEIAKLKIFLQEKDRRRNTDHKRVFSWLT